MGARKSKRLDVPPQLQLSEAQVKRLLDAKIKEYERKREEEAFITAQRKLQEEAASIAAQRMLQEEAFIAAQKKLQQEAATLAAQRKLQEDTFIAAQRKLQEEATKVATQKKLQEEALIAAQRKFREEGAKRKQQEDVANEAFQVFLEGSLSAFEREAAKKKQQDEATTRAFQEAPAPSYLKAPVPVPHREPFPRSCLVSRHREMPREANVLRYCSTCYTRSIMKMLKCENGHGSCNDCKIKGRACGICRSNLTNRWCYDSENLVAQTKVPCPHARQGCVLHIKIADMENHVQECPFKEHVCPLGAVLKNCRWLGQISELSSHFADMHPNFLHTKMDTEFHIRNIHRDYRYIICLVEQGYHFIFHQKISKNDSKVYMAVQLIGTKISAKKWVYEIHVYNKSENRRFYIYADNCRSSIDDMDDVFRSGECAVLPMWYANTFANNETLTFKFFIMENRRGFDRNQRGRDYSEEEEEDNGWSGSCIYHASHKDEREIRQ